MAKSKSSRMKTPPSEEAGDYIAIPSRDITHHDICLGRGNAIAHSEGNMCYRAIVWKYRESYASASRVEKRDIANQVIDEVYSLDPPGRFIEKTSTGKYREVPHERIIEKCCQSLREKKYKTAPSITAPPLKEESSGSSLSHMSKTVLKKKKTVSQNKETSSFEIPPLMKRSSGSSLTQKSNTVSSPIKRTAKHKRRAKAITGKKMVKTKIDKQPRTRKIVAKGPDPTKTNSTHDEEDDEAETKTVVPVCDKASFINAKKLLLGKKLLPGTKPPPLEQLSSIQSIEPLDHCVEECENNVFDGMFNLLPLSLVEFYSGQGSDGKNSREKTREESLESPTTVLDELSFVQPIPLHAANSLYLEGESKWVNPADNVTANVVAAWTEFATNGCFAKYG